MTTQWMKEMLFGAAMICIGTPIQPHDHAKYLGNKVNLIWVGVGAALFFSLMLVCFAYAMAGALVSPKPIGIVAIVASFSIVGAASWLMPKVLKKATKEN